MPSHFGRGFEAFGRPVPIRGMTPPPVLAAAPAPVVAVQPALQPQLQAQPQARPVPPGRIQVYRKGDPGAPPCPVCRG
jgi:hypothetical protein